VIALDDQTRADLQLLRATGDLWRRWRAERLLGIAVGDPPSPGSQDDEGGFVGPSGRSSAGATGEALCHLIVMGLQASGPAAIAGDWLAEARTPALAWLDAPGDVPGDVDDPAAGRVWATASAACGLLAAGRDPGPRALALLRKESDVQGRFTGGTYPTFAAAGAYWLAEGPKTETAEWSLRWAREWEEEWWGPWEYATALTFWGAARIPSEHPSVEYFLETLVDLYPQGGWPEDPGLTLRALEVVAHYER
jgi:hypothetical protein